MPHGLVWQATEDEPLDLKSSGTRSSTEPPIQVTSPSEFDGKPKPPRPVRENDPSSTRPLPFLVQIDLTRNVIEQRLPAVTPVIPQPTDHLTRNPAGEDLAQVRGSAAEWARVVRHQVRRIRNSLLHYSVACGRHGQKLAASIRGMVSYSVEFLRSAKLGHKMRVVADEAYGIAVSSTAAFRTRMAPYLESSQAKILSEYRRMRTKRLIVRFHTPSLTGEWNSPAARAAIRQIGSRSHIFFARARAQWTLKRFERDPRAWAAMIMGAVCALLVLGFVSIVRHYATDALPNNRILREDSSRQAAESQIGPERPKLRLSNGELPVSAARPERERSSRVQQAAGRKTSTAGKSRPKERANPDDDYVAKDSYVYYGTEGAPSH